MYDPSVGQAGDMYTIHWSDIKEGGLWTNGQKAFDMSKFRLVSLEADGKIKAPIVTKIFLAAINKNVPADKKRKRVGTLDEFMHHPDVGHFVKRVRGVRHFRLKDPSEV
jgi:hypothetical protein